MSLRYRTMDGTATQVYLGTNGTSNFWIGNPEVMTTVDELHPGPPYRTGGPFLKLWTRYHRGLTSPIHWYGIGIPRRYYTGSFTDNWLGTYPHFNEGPAILPTSYQKDGTELNGLGTTCWSRFKPGRPGSSTGQFVGELHRIPTIPFLGNLGIKNFKELKKFRHYGDEYLNLQFGWLPFLNDLREMYNVYTSMSRRLAQLRRDNGQWVRRRGSLHRDVSPSTESTTYHTNVLYPVLTSEFYIPGAQGSRKITVDYTDKVWFSAAFKYWIPNIHSPDWPASAKRALFGLNPSPALLWELLPWSWLIDWFTNLGDVIDNFTVNAASNLVAKYAYVMASRSKTYTCVSTQPFAQGTLSCTTQVMYSCKQRQHATPFGFDTDFSDLSGRQKTILAALGISRLPR